MTTIAKQANALILPGFKLDPKSDIHGAPHWARVARNGLMLVQNTQGASSAVVEWFAYLHDSQRVNDDRDPNHGRRASEFAMDHRAELNLTPIELYHMRQALASHSDGYRLNHPTIQCCWDADRLDLPRVGVFPDHRRMCTPTGIETAKKFFANRSRKALHNT